MWQAPVQMPRRNRFSKIGSRSPSEQDPLFCQPARVAYPGRRPGKPQPRHPLSGPAPQRACRPARPPAPACASPRAAGAPPPARGGGQMEQVIKPKPFGPSPCKPAATPHTHTHQLRGPADHVQRARHPRGQLVRRRAGRQRRQAQLRPGRVPHLAVRGRSGGGGAALEARVDKQLLQPAHALGQHAAGQLHRHVARRVGVVPPGHVEAVAERKLVQLDHGQAQLRGHVVRGLRRVCAGVGGPGEQGRARRRAPAARQVGHRLGQLSSAALRRIRTIVAWSMTSRSGRVRRCSKKALTSGYMICSMAAGRGQGSRQHRVGSEETTRPLRRGQTMSTLHGCASANRGGVG